MGQTYRTECLWGPPRTPTQDSEHKWCLIAFPDILHLGWWKSQCDSGKKQTCTRQWVDLEPTRILFLSGCKVWAPVSSVT